jgi:mannose-6-phosphate isomerase-like protein (cupin superfamily)
MVEYDIHLDDKFGQLREFDVDAFAAEHAPWFNQTLTTVNDSVIRLGVLDGQFHWHKHEHDDEFFLVLDGKLEIEIEGREPAVLGPRQAITIPRGVMHRPVAHGRTVVLMVEPAGVVPTGD